MTRVEWRTATHGEILANLGSLDRDTFEAAVENDAFNEEHVLLLLREPGLSAELLERISREPRFFRKEAVRVGLVLHPKLPRVRGLELIRYLYWRNQLRVAAQPRVHPQVRVVAEQALSERVPELTIGERIAIARIAGRAVLRVLRSDTAPRVIEALLRNARCTEEDASFIAASADTPPPVLAVLAKHPKWRTRVPVRAFLVKNRRLALPLALGLLPGLPQSELQGVARQADLPRLLRQSAERLLRTSGPRRKTDVAPPRGDAD